MAAPTRSRKQPPRKPAPAKPRGTFDRLRAEAAKARTTVIEPYVLDGEGIPEPIIIQAPETAEQQDALMNIGGEGAFLLKDAKRLLEITCGDAFPAVWDVVRGEHVTVMFQLIQELSAHFQAQGALEEVDGEDFPVASEASLT